MTFLIDAQITFKLAKYLQLVLCQDKKLNNKGSYFFKDQGKKRRHSSSYGEDF